MRKKLIVLMTVLCLLFTGLAVIPVMASSDVNTTPVVDTFELNFNGDGGSTENVATTGTKADADLTGGKTLTISMDIVDSVIPERDLGVFMRLAKRASIEANQASNFLRVGTRLSNAGLGWVGLDLAKKPFTINELFKPGTTLKIEYKPYVDETHKGSFAIYKKVTGSDDSTFYKGVGKVDLPKENAPLKTGFYFNVYGDLKLTVQNYYIKVSDGTVLDNSFTYSYKGIEDAGGYQFDTSMSIKKVTDSKDYHILFNQSSAYFGAEQSINIPSGQSLVMEYDVIHSNLVKNNFNMGFVITPYNSFGTDNVEDADNSVAFLGNSAFDKAQYPTYCMGPYKRPSYKKDQTMTGSFVPADIFATGNKVKAVYKPYVDEENKGTFEVYTASVFTGEYSLKFKVSDLTKDYAPADNVRIHTILKNGVNWLRNSNFTLHINNYRIYTTDNVNDTSKDIIGLGSSDKCIIKELEKPITIQSGLTPDTSNVVYAKPGAKVIVRCSEIGGYKFVGWYDNNDKLVDKYTVDAVMITEDMTSITARFIKIPDFAMVDGASIRTSDPTGLRFKTEINSKEYDEIAKYARVIKLSTIIVPEDMIQGVEFTKKALDEKKIKYLDIENQGWFNEATASQEGKYAFCGSIVNILDQNLTRKFSAISYMEINVNGSVTTVYSAKSVTRSVYEVAKKVVADPVATETEKKIVTEKYLDTVIEINNNEIVTFAGYTSPYQIKVVDKTITITTIADMKVKTALVNNVVYEVTKVDANTATITLA